MKIKATFWLNDEDETSIPMMMDNLSAPPFVVGDRIYLSIDDLYPKEISEIRESEQKNLVKSNNHARDKFHLKTIEIVKVIKAARFNIINAGTLTIEYYCKLLDDDEVNNEDKTT